jgi:uncharacterized protein YciI
MNIYVVYLKFGKNKAMAREFMTAHNDWIKANVGDGKFLIFGSLTSNEGGCVLALAENVDILDRIISEDPFVKEEIVIPEVVEVSVNGSHPKLSGLI